MKYPKVKVRFKDLDFLGFPDHCIGENGSDHLD